MWGIGAAALAGVMSRMRPTSPGGFQRRPRVADSMTRELYACVDRSMSAERSGDVVAALEWHQAVPMFRKGRHRAVLTGLADLGDDLPEWVWARWIAYQSVRCEDGGVGRRHRELVQGLMRGLHGDLLADCFRRQDDPIRVAATVMGESWAFHQLSAHEHGGIRDFVEEFATGRLAEHAALPLRWAGTPMTGYQLGESRPGTGLRVREAQGGGWLEVLDLGARSCSPGGYVLGRLVPSGLGSTLMFDTPPLGVPEHLARAANAGVAWWDVAAAYATGTGSSSLFLREDYELTGDVPELELLRFGTAPRDLGRVMQQLREGRDEIGRAAYRVLDRARRGDVAATDHCYVAAAALNVRAFDDMRRQTVGVDDADHWAEWAERVVAPARGRLLALARLGRSAA